MNLFQNRPNLIIIDADSSFQISQLRDCVIIIRRGGGGGVYEKLELSSKKLDSTPPPKQKKLVLTPSVMLRLILFTFRIKHNAPPPSND